MLTVPRTLAKMTKRITSLRTIEPPRELKPFPCFMSWHPRLTNEAAHAWLREQVRIVARSRAPTRGVVFTEDVVKIAGQQGRYAIGHGLSPLGIECGLRYLDPEWRYCSDLIGSGRLTTFPLYFGSHAFR